MKLFYSILLIFTFHSCFSQLPDYSNLSKKEKLSYMNAYGFVVLKSGDTILAKVDYIYAYNKPNLSDHNELKLKYPKYIKKYAYKEKIPLSEIEKFYFGSPPLYHIVKKYRNEFVNFEVVTLGRYTIYIRQIAVKKTYMNSIDSDFPRSYQGTSIEEVLYIQKEDGPLVKIYEDDDYDLQTLKALFALELSEEKINELIKGSNIEKINNRIIEAVKKLNQE